VLLLVDVREAPVGLLVVDGGEHAAPGVRRYVGVGAAAENLVELLSEDAALDHRLYVLGDLGCDDGDGFAPVFKVQVLF
jgi:hypothetical protein